jgi:hypothetical protein
VPHVDPDLLALYVRGGSLPAAAATHLAGCPDCATEAAVLDEVAALGRTESADRLVRPPSRVWAGIVSATGFATRAAPSQRGMRWAFAAAIASLLAGVGLAVGWQAVGADARPEVVAETVLEPLAERPAAGTAAVVDAASERRLVVSVDAPDAGGGYLAVWLLAPDVSGLVPLGVLVDGAADLVIPAGLDLASFSVVDVSVEPYDGDPAHSGDSLVRGRLDGT